MSCGHRVRKMRKAKLVDEMSWFIYISIYIYREREREREGWSQVGEKEDRRIILVRYDEQAVIARNKTASAVAPVK